MEECIFCKIVKKESPAEIFFEDESVIAFKSVPPIAPVHILIIPKEHIQSIAHLPKDEKGERIAGRLISVARSLAIQQGIEEGGYKLLFRVGNDGGQEIPHIHLHLIGGGKMSEDIKVIN